MRYLVPGGSDSGGSKQRPGGDTLHSGRFDDGGDQQVQAKGDQREALVLEPQLCSQIDKGFRGVVSTLEQAPGQRSVI